MTQDPEDAAATEEAAEEDRRARAERRKLIDLTRAERGEPERRRLPGVERRGLAREPGENPNPEPEVATD